MVISKLRKTLVAISLIASISVLSGCYGNFTLTKKIYDWNGGLGSPIVNTAVMWVLLIVPIYEIAGFVDFVFLNTIEHYTGSNPIGMDENQSESQMVQSGDKIIKIETRKNLLTFYQMDNEVENFLGKLEYNQDAKTWTIVTPERTVELAKVNDSNPNILEVLDPHNKKLLYNTLTNQVVAN